MDEKTLFRRFAVHFVFVSFSYRDLYVTSIIQMPHTLNIKCGRRQIFVMKYRISTNMRGTHLAQETVWSRKGKSSQMMDSSMSPRRSLSSFHLKWEMVTFTKHYPTKILDNLPPSINPSRIKVTIASMFISG